MDGVNLLNEKEENNYFLGGKSMDTTNYIILKEEASRCLLCHEPPCSTACPAHKNPAGIIMSLRMDNYKVAVKKAEKAYFTAGKCQVACDNKMYCQKSCIRGKIDRPIRIKMIQEILTYKEGM
jgi:dihydropyrimidine dehydrogenase (NAD+) subunit PreT